MLAFERALPHAQYIELDVRLSKDKELVVIHDATVNRTTNGRGLVVQLTTAERQFLLMPLMHAEDLELQEICVEEFRKLENEQALGYAIAHRDIVARFGRFPHRNEILDRESTEEECTFLQRPGSSF